MFIEHNPSSEIGISCASSSAALLLLRLLGGRFLLDNVEHLSLDGLLLEYKAVLVPDEVRAARVELVSLHAAFEQADDVPVVRVLSEAQAAAVVHELLELLWLVLAQLLNASLLLLLLDVGVLLSLGSSGKALPRETASEEVEDHVANGLKVVSSRLLVTKMGVDRSVSGRTSQVLAVSEGNVLAIRRLVALGQTEVDDVDGVLRLVVAANQEVVRLDVTMDDALFVNDLDSLDHLHGDVQDCLEVELSSALLEQVFERLSEQVHNHNVVHLAVFGLLVTHEVQVRNRGLAP